MTKNKIPNRLISEKSPYLLQHAYNPVNWYPWSEEAFEKAKEEDKPIFLSIGYSTCHWCHVMERESFEDNEVAQLLNKHFISIKVDREERPDVDHIYMSVCQALTGHGGWPLTIIMTPEKKPFFAGTYFPKHDSRGMAGIISIFNSIIDAWKDNRDKLLQSSEQILNFIHRNRSEQGEIEEEVFLKAFHQLKEQFDSHYGGFGRAPKFPTPHQLYFLLRYWYKTEEPFALEMIETTLKAMHSGGIYDHIGYGFSRYSTDEKWLVPHFEKMLYDNALLAIAYIEVYQVTKKTEYAKVAEEIFTYILRDMTSSGGAFYSAEDADSEGVEGKFYVWTVEEVKSVLGNENGGQFCNCFNITPEGNFEGKSIPNLIQASLKKEDENFIQQCREQLFKYREKRIHPHKDDKILTSWNGLMIAALAIGGRALNNEEYITTARKAVSFIENNMIRKDGRLLARYRDEEAAFPAYVDDYAFLIWGLIELYETTFDSQYLKIAIRLNEDFLKYFWDEDNGGFFVYGSDSEQLITRPKEVYDGATPSGNSVAALNFLRLAHLIGDIELEDKARQIFKLFSKDVNYYPTGYTFLLMALLFEQSPVQDIVIIAKHSDKQSKELIDIIGQQFRPFTVALFYKEDDRILKECYPNIVNYQMIDEKPTAYVCQNFTCQKPFTNSKELKGMLLKKL